MTNSASITDFFNQVRKAAHANADTLLHEWVPNVIRKGDERLALNPMRNDTRIGSFKVNIQKGVWSDFATNDKGDLISLHQYIYGGTALTSANAIADRLGIPTFGESKTDTPNSQKKVARNKAASGAAIVPPEAMKQDPFCLPLRDQSRSGNSARFIVAGNEGPPTSNNEIRRHAYKIGTAPVKVKIKLKDGGWVTWYRVVDGDVCGWQSRKPKDFREPAYFGHTDPFDPDQIDQPIYWTEGEKDADTLSSQCLLTITFGGGDGFPAGCEKYFEGRDVIIPADNDASGEQQALKKARLLSGIVKSIKIVRFPFVPKRQDVSYFLSHGGTVDQLQDIVSQTPFFENNVPQAGQAASEPTAPASGKIVATPYEWVSPEAIPPRDFLLGSFYIRKFVSATIAPGATGKSTLLMCEALSAVSGKSLIGITPSKRLRVWLWNLEDPMEEIQRHVQATARYYNLIPQDLDGLFIDSGRKQQLVTAISDGKNVVLQEGILNYLADEIKQRQIDILIIDPFISSHEAAENDNSAMDRIIKSWAKIAERANCAVMLVHHTRKTSPGEGELTVESSRGGKAFTDACRSVRVLNRMTKKEAEKASVDNHRRYFRTYDDKPNLAPPADSSTWFELVSVDLRNAPNGRGDAIGVSVSWTWPDLMANVTVAHLREVQNRVAAERFRENHQAKDWVGKVVADVCHFDLNKPADKQKCLHALKTWFENGMLVKYKGKDDKGNDRYFVRVGERAND